MEGWDKERGEGSQGDDLREVRGSFDIFLIGAIPPPPPRARACALPLTEQSKTFALTQDDAEGNEGCHCVQEIQGDEEEIREVTLPACV